MALYTEKALLNMIHKEAPGRLRPIGYTGLYYEDPLRVDKLTGEPEKRYIVLGKQMGNPDRHTTNPSRQERKLKRKKTWWPEDKKVEAATLHVAIGNLVKVSELTKVPVGTLRQWADNDWWLVTQQRVKREAIEETDARFSKLIDKAINKLEKAVESGDYMYDIKKGELVNIPMTGRDLAMVTGITFDKRQLLRGEATRITKTSDPEKHLAELARKFAELVQENRKSLATGEIVDAEVIEPDKIGIKEDNAQYVQRPDDSPIPGDSVSTLRGATLGDEQLPGGVVQAQEDAGDVGTAAPTEDAADADDVASTETPGFARH